jgi:2-C-methyl-D-erythritol 4-phosphate cytidylyltransferase
MLGITLDSIAAAACYDLVAIAAPAARWDEIRRITAGCGLANLVLLEGGERRQDSVSAAIGRCDGYDWISVHDAARPLTPPEIFRAVLEAARADGAATAGVPCVDTVKQVLNGHVQATLERSSIIASQTPQSFRADVLRRAHLNAATNGITAGDDAALVEAIGEPVTVVPGDPRNFKVTFPQDLVLLRSLLEEVR